MRHQVLHRSLCAAALLATAPLAQNDYAFDRTSAGTLGASLNFSFSGAPANKSILFMLSVTTGPTPLSLLNPGDTRSLSVGLEAAYAWFSQSSGTGSGTFSIPVPNQAGLHAALVYFQTCTLPGNPFIVDKISNNVAVHLGIAERDARLPNSLPNPRAYGPGFDIGGNKFILVGGRASATGTVGTPTTDIWNVRTLSVTPGPSMFVARAFSSTTQLANGKILVAGGVDPLNNVLNSCELYDPVTNTWRFVTSMNNARVLHSARLLKDGRVLVVGGTTDVSGPLAALGAGLTSCEIYNPTTNAWSSTGSVAQIRFLPGLMTLNDGRVLHSGGFEVIKVFGIPIPQGTIATCQLYNPTTGTWSAAAAMPNDRAGHGFNQVLLNDGRVLVSGGLTSGADPTQGTTIATVDLYNPTNNTWQTGSPMSNARGLHTTTLMPNGKVISTGGAGGLLTALVPTDHVQEFDPTTRTWRTLTPLSFARVGHDPELMPDGLLVLFGGADSASQIVATIDTWHQ